MTTIYGPSHCATCSKDKMLLKCEDCLQHFCANHLVDHRQLLNKQLKSVEVVCELIRESLTEQTSELEEHPLLQKVNDWEEESIKKIRQTANDARQLLAKQITKQGDELGMRLNNISNQIKESRAANDLHEKDIRQWTENLSKLKEELPFKQSCMTVRQDSMPLVKKIALITLVPQLSIEDINTPTTWKQNGITIAGGHGSGNERNQLYNPLTARMDNDNETIYVADYWNNRIMKLKPDPVKGGLVVNGSVESNQLNRPRDVLVDQKSDSLIICDDGNRHVVQCPRRKGSNGKVIISDIDCGGLAMDAQGYLYVSDYTRHEVRRWKIGDTNGTLVAGGHGPGNRLNQLNHPAHIVVDHEQSVYISDSYNHRVMKWKLGAKEGIIVAGSQTEGNGLEQLSNPTGLVIDDFGTVFVADCNNHRVMRWSQGAIQGSIVVGGNSHGEKSNQLYNPWGIGLDRQGNLYVADNANHRLQKFNVV